MLCQELPCRKAMLWLWGSPGSTLVPGAWGSPGQGKHWIRALLAMKLFSFIHEPALPWVCDDAVH